MKLGGEGKDCGADVNTDGDVISIDGAEVTYHNMLGGDTRTRDGMTDGGKAALSQDDIGSTTSSVSGTVDSNIDIGIERVGESESELLAPSPVIARR